MDVKRETLKMKADGSKVNGNNYIFYWTENEAVCLLWDESNRNFKLSNLKSDQDQKQKAIRELSIDEQKAKLYTLTPACFLSKLDQSNGIVAAIIRISNIIEKNMKPSSISFNRWRNWKLLLST